jgi:hypothetical protein
MTGPIIVAKLGPGEESGGSGVDVDVDVGVDADKLKSGALVSHTNKYRLTDRIHL